MNYRISPYSRKAKIDLKSMINCFLNFYHHENFSHDVRRALFPQNKCSQFERISKIGIASSPFVLGPSSRISNQIWTNWEGRSTCPCGWKYFMPQVPTSIPYIYKKEENILGHMSACSVPSFQPLSKPFRLPPPPGSIWRNNK